MFEKIQNFRKFSALCFQNIISQWKRWKFWVWFFSISIQHFPKIPKIILRTSCEHSKDAKYTKSTFSYKFWGNSVDFGWLLRTSTLYSTFPNKWKFEQMEILCFFLQLIREQMEISVISCQMRLFFAISLQLVREQMEI